MTQHYSDNQEQTKNTFGFKWAKRDTYESPAVQAEWQRWLLEKYFDGDDLRVKALLGTAPQRILDAGCGSAGSALLLFGDLLRDHEYIGVDISDSVDVARQRFQERSIPGTFYQTDLNRIPDDRAFDIIFSEGVLHHTDSVADSLKSLTEHLRPGGTFLFYVYAKKAPIREFTDDHIRHYLAGLDDQEAWDSLLSLTKLGEALGQLNVTVNVPEDIPFLGIEAGSHDLQRLFYYKICKAFYRPEYTVDEMNHINFDWFRPMNCHRHTVAEVRDFCRNAGLKPERVHAEESGITVIAKKI